MAPEIAPRSEAVCGVRFESIPEQLALSIVRAMFGTSDTSYGKGRAGVQRQLNGAFTMWANNLDPAEAARGLARYRVWKRGGPV